MNTSATPVPENSGASPPLWEKIGNFVVLLAYSAVVLFTVRYHEKWADEAQAWLLARDLDLRTLWFHELRYEGSPGLWHTILWFAQHVFHASYNSISYIGAAFAIAGAALLIVKAPFPWFVRWPLAFTYVFVYQYAVLARPYTLLPLLCFSSAMMFKDARHPERMTAILLLMSNLSLHGMIMAACIGLVYLLDAVRKWESLDAGLRRRYWICIGIMALAFVFLFFVLRPTPDVGEFAPKDEWAKLFPQPTRMHKLLSIVSGALFDFPLPSFAFLALAGVWCLTRRRFAIFALPVTLLIGLYTFVHGYAHHHGTVFVAVVTALWIAWPSALEKRAFDTRSRLLLHGMTALLLALCALNIVDAAVVIQHEYLYPYSGALDAANYLKLVNPDRQPVFGYLFGVVALQPYFESNIFANMPTTYYHQGIPLRGVRLDTGELKRVNPEYVVAYSTDPQLMLDTDGPLWTSLGYQMVHFSDGYYLYKRVVYQREAYLIFRRIHSTDEQTPQPVGPGK